LDLVIFVLWLRGGFRTVMARPVVL